MASLEEIGAALKAADAAGNAEDAQRLAAAYRQMQAQQQPSDDQWVTPGQGEKTWLSDFPVAGPVFDAASEFTRSLYPVEKNSATGELRPAVPKIIPAIGQGIADAFTLPGDVAQGRVDPLSEAGVDRGVGFAATFGAGPLKSAVAPISKAATNTARALKADGLTVTELPQALKNVGTEAMPLDLGPNLQRQAGALAALPGSAQKTVRSAIEERVAGAPARVEGDVAATVGTSPDIFKLTEDITAAQKAASDPLYAAVRDVQIKVPPAMAFIAKSPMGQQAFNMAREMAANDGYSPQGMTVGLADYAKRALDDVASSAAAQGKGNAARQARNMAKALTAAVDAQAPGYKTARDAFAGPAMVKDAIEEGQKALSKEISPSQLKSALDGMSPSERDGYLAGFQGSIEAQLGNAVNEPLALRNTFRKGWNEAKLRLLLGNDIADDLLKRIDREATFSKSRTVVAEGSETAARNAAAPEVKPQESKITQMTAFGALLLGIEKARAKYRATVQPKVNDDMAAFLASKFEHLSPGYVSEVDRAMKPQPFLPSAMKDLTRAGVTSQPKGDYLDQLAAYGLLPGLHT